MSDLDDFFSELDSFKTQSLDERMEGFLQQRTASALMASRSDSSRSDRKRERNAERSAPKDFWECPMCTLHNPLDAPSCEACGHGYEAVAATQQSWLCGACGVVNPPGESRRCQQCRAKKRRSMVLPARAATTTQDELIDCDEAEGLSPLSAAADGALASLGTESAPSSAVDDSQLDEPVQLAPEDEEFDEESEDEAVDDDDDDDEASNASQLQEQHLAGRASKAEENKADKELISFLENLNTVPYEDLLEATTPASMLGKGQLKSFQLQGLYWLMTREGHVVQHEQQRTGHEFLDGLLFHDSSARSSTSAVDRRLSRGGEVAAAPSSPAGNFYYSGGILADYMGLGKTRMLISLCEATKIKKADRLQFNRVSSHATIIICPMSLMSQWVREITTCVTPPPRILRYYGANRGKSIFEIGQSYDYVITSYQTLSREPPDGAIPPSKLRMIYWRRIILDEAHYIRNSKSLQSRAVLNVLDGKFRWAVTATPLQNKLDDLYPLLNFLQIPHFADRSWWNAEIQGPLAVNKESPRAVAALRLLFSSLMLRRLPTSTIKGVAILNLPEKKIVTRLVELSKDEREFYDAVHENGRAKIQLAARGGGPAIRQYSTAFEMLIRCRQCCLHPYIVVAALMKKAEMQGLDYDALLPSVSSGEGGATEADLARFLDKMKKKLAADSNYAQQALAGVANNEVKNNECIICLDSVNVPAMLPCAHVFCFECITHALVSTASKCPLCKIPVKKCEIMKVPEVAATSTPMLTSLMEKSTVLDPKQWTESSKARALLDIIVNQSTEGEKLVVFSHFTTFLRYFATVLDRHKITYAFFTGEMSANQRDDVTQRFTRRENPRVLLATITACGVGINLTRASQCIIADPSWNPGVEEQAMNRIHRIGQERPVTITKLLSPQTVDEDIEKLAEHKRSLCGYLYHDGVGKSGAVAAGASRLGKDELLAMFATRSPLPPAPGAPPAPPIA